MSSDNKDYEAPRLFDSESLWRRIDKVGCTALLSLFVSGCASAVVPTLRQPDRLYSNQEEIAEIKTLVGPTSSHVEYLVPEDERNNFISLRMYAIDAAYTTYESQLTHEAQETSLGSSLINLGLTGAASIVPAGEAPRVLSAIATGVTGAGAAYDKDILLSQAIQNLETQMRTDRNNQAAVILASMQCSVRDYPYGTALSDLEDYYRAGTLTNALIGISKTVGSAEMASKAAKAVASASPKVVANGQNQLVADAAVVKSQAAPPVPSGRCTQGSMSPPMVATTTPMPTTAASPAPSKNNSPPPPPTQALIKQLHDACSNITASKQIISGLTSELANDKALTVAEQKSISDEISSKEKIISADDKIVSSLTALGVGICPSS
jgi:hypothetical protein